MAEKVESTLNEKKDNQETDTNNEQVMEQTEERGNEEGRNEEEEIDIRTPCWFYQDTNGLRQGPFSFKEMFLWWKGGYFSNDLPVKQIWEDEFSPLSSIPQFYNASVKLVEKIEREQDEELRGGYFEVPLANNYYEAPPKEDIPKPNYQEYSVTGTFNPSTGKFQKEDGSSYFASKGIPVDRDQRMMAHYFDYEKYAAQKSAAKEEGKKKQIKGSKKFWKERKEKKRRAKLIAEYLAD